MHLKADRTTHRSAFAGTMLALMVVLAWLSHLTDGIRIPLVASGVAAWIAAALLIGRITTTQRVVCSLLVAVGVAGIIIALRRGEAVDLAQVFVQNQGLLTMLACVSFLRLVALDTLGAGSALPVGKTAFRQTLLGVGVFGAIINLSAPLLIADRIQAAGKFDGFAARSITRIFSGCSAWSPFFGGMAVVITYVSHANLLVLMLAGLPFAVIGGLLTYFLACARDPDEVSAFTGYPMNYRNLWIPALLAATVALLYVASGVSILICIALGAVIVTVTLLIARTSVTRAAIALSQHITGQLPNMASELLLFLSAGVLATGLAAAIKSMGVEPFSQFTATTAIGLLAGMVLAACAGIHPVILVSTLATVFAPSQPAPNLLAFTFLLAWSLGTSCSPLSGTHLVIQARYGIPSLTGALRNWPFVALMFIVGTLLIAIIANLI